MRRLEALDALRGLAAFIVVLFHYTYRYFEFYNQELNPLFSVEFGHYGVQLFFIISGFVIFMTLQRIEKPIDFIFLRFIRLYPTYWIAILLTFTLVTYFGLEGREVSFKDMLINFSMVQYILGIDSVDGVYWTLLIELNFYFWIFMIYIFSSLKRIENISFVILILANVTLGFGYNEIYIIFKIFEQLFVLEYIPFFIMGIMFYKIYNNEAKYFSYFVLVFSMLTTFFVCKDNSLIVLSIIYITFFLFVFNFLNWLAIKPLVYLGTVSYSLYLTHQNIGYIFMNKLISIGININISIVLAIILSIVIATIMTYVLERKIIYFLKTKYKSNKNSLYKSLERIFLLKSLVKQIRNK